MDGAVKTITF